MKELEKLRLGMAINSIKFVRDTLEITPGDEDLVHSLNLAIKRFESIKEAET